MYNKVMPMTLYFFAFAWGIYILFSLIGWGGVLNRLLFPKQQVDWGQRAAWGIAFSIFVGGVLNLTWTISKEVISIYLGLGFIYCLINGYKTRHFLIISFSQYVGNCRKDRVLLIGTTIVLFLILLRYAGSIATNNFNIHDDYHGYLVFPNQMLQMGSIGIDPFGARRNYSLGGGSFLGTFVLTTLSEENLNIIDSGIGLLTSVGVIISFFQRKETTKKVIIFILFLFLLLDLNIVNISPVIVAIALFFSLFKFLNSEQLRMNHFIANACIIALIAAALCALKLNLIVPSLLLLSLSYLFHLIDTKFEKKAIYEILSFTCLFIFFLLPWMLQMYQSADTYLYPLLGKGYHGSVYGTPIAPQGDLTISTVLKILEKVLFSPDFLCLCLLSFTIIWKQRRRLIYRGSPLILIGSATLGKILLSLATGGSVPYRYSVPFIVPTLIILMIIVLEDTKQENLLNLARCKSVIIALFVAGLLLIGLGNSKDIIVSNFSNSLSGLRGVSLASQQKTAQYAAMLEVVPLETPILTRLSMPFLLDFRKHKIFLADYPGHFSPPPGMPFFKGSEALANYLRLKSIRYVAYSYAHEANFQFKKFKNRLSPQTPPWRRAQAKLTFDFQDNLRQLGDTRKRIYDDGENFIIDLLS